MLGLAVRPRQNALVFYNRIFDVTRRRAVDGGVLLGRVMAHETGHLLLPPGRHHHYGIMRGDIDVDVTHPSRFTREEAGRIQGIVDPAENTATGHHSYSERSATSGSTVTARRTGT